MFCVCSFSMLLLISTAIQFWTTDYLKKVLDIQETLIFVAFVVTCVTAPTLGIIMGGCIVEKYGGYESRSSLFICSVFGLGALITGVPIVIFNGILGFTIFLWLFLFFGSAIVPNLMGIIISSLPYELRGAGNSVALLFATTLGRLPSPTIYGLIFDVTRKSQPKMAYGLIVNLFSIISLVLVVIGTIFRERLFKQKMQEYEIKKAKTEQELKMNPNKSENENLKDNSEIKINCSDDITPSPKDSFKIVDEYEDKFKDPSRGRSKKALSKAKENEKSFKKNESEINIKINIETPKVEIKRPVDVIVNENVYSKKRVMSKPRKIDDPYNYFDVPPVSDNSNRPTKRPASNSKTKRL